MLISKKIKNQMIIFIYSKQEIIHLLLNYKLYHIETLLDLLKKLLKKRMLCDFEELRKFTIEEWNKRLGNYPKKL